MTNREYMVAVLTDQVDDGGASYEAVLHYDIKCPYFEGDQRAHCDGKDDSFINRDNCYYCKHEWMESEVDE